LDQGDWRAERFEETRGHLRAVAYRMLGSVGEADDAVQEAWLRFDRSDTSGVANLGGWLTTVVARVCLDMLRARKSRGEEPLTPAGPGTVDPQASKPDPEQEVLLADSVGLALLVVLETLGPAERLAFVLHDMFDLSFEEIAPIVDRSPEAARQLASRARRRVRGAGAPDANRSRQRTVVEAFLAAARTGDFEGLLAVLDPDVVRRIDAGAVPPGAPTEMRGAQNVAKAALAGARRGSAPVALALINGAVGVILAPGGRLTLAMQFETRDDRIARIDVVADPERLRKLEVALLED